MISLVGLKKHWDRIQKIPNGFSQLDEDHPLAWYIGYDVNMHRALYVEVSDKIGKLKASKSFDIKIVKMDNGKLKLFISLLEENLSDVFISMIADLLNFSLKGTNYVNASNLFIQRYIQWDKLFKRNLKDIMSLELQQGLIGELWFLYGKIKENTLSKQQVLDGWFGPECEHQDFYYGDRWFEIKTVKENSDKVTISSMQQLSLENQGTLIIYYLHRCDKNSSSFSLNDLVKRIYTDLEDNLNLIDTFKIKLSLYGYIEREEYGEKYYTVISKRKYNVDNDFPRLLANNIPPAVVNARYSLSIASLNNWEIK